ncbi:MAG TPA: SRPBCC domain-containing protein [Actinomycetota bacterium]|nr:SRPBCC domain-containing protein [Actinomycetota bacterium]
MRRFSVAPDVVYDAFTNPESMRIWWGENTTFDIDLRVGGRWTVIRREDDTEYLATGEYLVVERPSRLVYGYGMPQFSPNTDTIWIDIASDEGGSVVTFEVSGEDIAGELREVPEGEISASEDGWRQGFDLLDAAWSESLSDSQQGP